jgi:hypothetical protein
MTYEFERHAGIQHARVFAGYYRSVPEFMLASEDLGGSARGDICQRTRQRLLDHGALAIR